MTDEIINQALDLVGQMDTPTRKRFLSLAAKSAAKAMAQRRQAHKKLRLRRTANYQCPECGAAAGEPCRTAKGRPIKDLHRSREAINRKEMLNVDRVL